MKVTDRTLEEIARSVGTKASAYEWIAQETQNLIDRHWAEHYRHVESICRELQERRTKGD